MQDRVKALSHLKKPVMIRERLFACDRAAFAVVCAASRLRWLFHSYAT